MLMLLPFFRIVDRGAVLDESVLVYDVREISDQIAVIKYRNRWMIDHSDIILIYSKRTYGGAYEARRYAENEEKEITYISAK